MSGIPVIEISGTPRERGIVHGRAQASGIARFYDRWIQEAGSGVSPIRELDAIGFAMGPLPQNRTKASDLVEEVEGIVEGA